MKNPRKNAKNSESKIFSFKEKYSADPRFRAKISLFVGLAANIFYIIVKLFAGIAYRSAWFCSLAGYYVLLAAMRLVLAERFIEDRPDILREYRLCRRCGILLLLMNQALAGIVVFMVRQNRGFDYPGYLIYAMAFYSFYAVIAAAIATAKSKKRQSPALSAAKAIDLVAALVSILSLTTAMLSRFGENDPPEFRTTMVSAVGGGVCTIVILTAIYMIYRSTKGVRALKEKENGCNR